MQTVKANFPKGTRSVAHDWQHCEIPYHSEEDRASVDANQPKLLSQMIVWMFHFEYAPSWIANIVHNIITSIDKLAAPWPHQGTNIQGTGDCTESPSK